MSDYRDGGLILDGPFDPDAQATVTDYIDYTEYLPADIIRSLTLIRGLDDRYLESAQGVHNLTKTYGQLPDLPPDGRPDARTLRRDISAQLDRAINARESAYAEACRLYDVVDRHFNRLDCIKQKLHALPKPASRDPTPPPQTLPNSKRRAKKAADEPRAPPTTRITLRLDSGDASTRSGAQTQQKSRTRRSMISGHLAGLHPDSPIASTEHSDAEAEPKVSPAESAPTQTKKDKSGRRSRTSGAATNAHAVAAGISTSNALAMLNPPPEDARPGSADMPWLRLTEWEMTKLRKKMKKNAVWQPSEVMIHRELALRGRGWEAYRAAKAEAEANGTELVDCDDIMNTYIPGKLAKRGDATDDIEEGFFETKLSNRGMKLNEAKKLKRENQAREQAAAAAAAASNNAKGLTNGTGSLETSTAGKSSRPVRKRKLDEAPAVEPAVAATPAEVETRSSLRSSAKRRKSSKESPSPAEANVDVSSSASVTAAPVAALEADASNPTPAPILPAETKRSIPAAPTVLAPKSSTATPPVTRPPSRRSAAASAEPASLPARELRRKSATPARRTPVPETSRAGSASAPVRRRKRPAPGPVSSGQDGGAAVSYGRRKAKPGKKRMGSREQGPDGVTREDIRIDEDGVLEEIDPNEPRYCICGDVSFGTMICCENQDCDREWFHLDCVGLSEVPGRTAKWYCPDCRVKFHKGMDGIVKNSSRR
ncbi:hypothetical protein BDV59DRAFT_169930 [Aspergillus ambiguus]|uniref:putative PHD finger domain protein n=1 Tax=Aspergillus ambiguus TaxID=176160 RepID=UPI003CCDDE46